MLYPSDGSEPPAEEYLGVVAEFDEAVGLGVVRADDGSAVPFHCIAVADGSRRIDVGVEVRFRLLPKLGRYEASDISPR